MILGVRHVGIVVSNLDASLHFYRDLLGLQVHSRLDESGAALDAVLGMHNTSITTVKLSAGNGAQIELLRFQSHKRREVIRRGLYNLGFSHVSFTVDDIWSVYLRLRHAGVHFKSEPLNMESGALVAFALDPDLNHVEFVEEAT